MEGMKIVAAGSVLVLLLVAVALQNPRVASTTESADDPGRTSILGDVLGETEGDVAEDNDGEQHANVDVSSSIKADISTNNNSLNFDINISSDSSSSSSGESEGDEGADSEEGSGEEPSEESNSSNGPFNINYNGVAYACPPGEEFESEDGALECENDDDGAVEIKWRYRN